MALHLNKLISPSHKDDFCQVWLKLAQWFWRRKFLNFVNVFSLFRNYLPLGKGRALHLNKLESPSPNNALCQIWLKLAQWFWRRRFLNFINVFSLFRNCLPLEKFEIGPVVLEKKMKMWKVYDNDNNNDDNDKDDDNDDGQRTNFDQKSSLEPSAQVS